jgi:hypothetical protein
MKRVSALGRGVATAAAAGLALAVVSGVAPASADQIGSLTFNNLTSQDVGFTVTTSGGCPTSPTNATNFQIRVTDDTSIAGNTAPTLLANITGNTAGSTIGGGINAGPFTATASATLATFASNNGLGSALPAGSYKVQLICRTIVSSTSLGEFAGRIVIGAGGSVVSAGPIIPVVDADTSTEVTAPTTAAWGASVTLTATVSNTTAPSGDKPVGTVQFSDGASTLGSPVSVGASGVATLTVNNLGLGDHPITAAFTAGTGFKDSADASAATVTVALAAPVVARAPFLTGSVKVGAVVTCNPGTWLNATSYTYEFLVNGVSKGAKTSFTYTPVAADLGKTLACKVNATNPVNTVSATSPAPKVATGSAAVATKKPKILFSGSAANVGETLKVYKGVWSPAASYTYTYTWKRGTKVLKSGTTATSYKATAADKGKTLTLTVTVKRTGYANGTATSAGVKVR